jgi:hypothetical protein
MDWLKGKYHGVSLYIFAFHEVENTKLLNYINVLCFMESGI